jgi:uncharacterized hydrophobic protein (TIGR00341 family)
VVLPKIIEVTAKKGCADTLVAIAEQANAIDWQVFPLEGGERECVRILVARRGHQPVIDRIESTLGASEGWRLLILPTEGTLPPLQEDDSAVDTAKARAVTASREELYGSIAGGAVIDSNFVLLVILSTIVAGIGLVSNSVAVIIGAMVIAPLLGPNLALAFGTSLGDLKLMARAARANLTGISLAIVLCAAFSALAHPELSRSELMARTTVGYEGIVLALASGAAAALSLTTGTSSALVGVMVAVALLPPAATVGLMAGAGHLNAAGGAAMLLAVNVISVDLAAQIVFAVRGIRPHRWFEKKSARQSTTLAVLIWIALLLAAIAAIAYQSN